MHEYFVQHKVTWIEATIACPVFTGLIVYYIEGSPEQRHHLMEATIAKPERAYGIRGNLFSFLMPWEKIHADIARVFERGDLSEWPLSPETVHQIVRVRMTHGPEDLLNKFKELRVRTAVVAEIVKIYIDSHVADLADRPGVLEIHGQMGEPTPRESLQKHAQLRLDRFYPEEKYPGDVGGIIPELVDMIQQQTEVCVLVTLAQNCFLIEISYHCLLWFLSMLWLLLLLLLLLSLLWWLLMLFHCCSRW